MINPYDRWGFSQMSSECDDLYWKYLIARVSAYRNVWWSHGGRLHGESPARIQFLQKIMEETPAPGLRPLKFRWDEVGATLDSTLPYEKYYIFYYSFMRPSFREYYIDEDTEFQVEVIDTWNMTIENRGVFKGKFRVDLPGRESFLAYLSESDASAQELPDKLPDAFIMENYQVSIGVMRALRQKNISVPEELSLIGIDELPEYLTGDIRMTALRIEHLERAHMAMVFLEQMIKGNVSGVFRTYSGCQLIDGRTIRKMK